MYLQLLAYLFQIINYQQQILILLLTIVLGRCVEQAKPEQPINKEYRKLVVDDLPVICPHCLKALEKTKERKEFNVWECKRYDSSYYRQKRRQMTKAEKVRFLKDPQAFKLRYVYHEFLFHFQPLSPVSPLKPRVDLSLLHTSPPMFGLILTYHVNYGISAR